MSLPAPAVHIRKGTRVRNPDRFAAEPEYPPWLCHGDAAVQQYYDILEPYSASSSE